MIDPDGEIFVVTADSLNVRALPSTDGYPEHHLRAGTHVLCGPATPDGRWRPLLTNHGWTPPPRTLWVSTKYLTPAKEMPKDREPPWLAIARAELGVEEVPGPGDNQRVVEYLRSTNLDLQAAANDETPWCSAFTNWCVEKSGYAGSDSAWARSWLAWGREVTTPRQGVVTVLTRQGGGHVGFYVGEDDDRISLLGGNQGDRVCIAKFPKSRLLGYRLPSSWQS